MKLTSESVNLPYFSPSCTCTPCPTLYLPFLPKSLMGQKTGLIIGLVVGIMVVLAIIAVTVATFVMKWKKKADYDLLD